jgi:nitrate/nitrite transporter NarK
VCCYGNRLWIPESEIHSDRTRERYWHAAVPYFLGGISFFLVVVSGSHLALALLFLTVVGARVSAGHGPVWALVSALFSESPAATSFGFINAVGNLGGFVGPFLMGYPHFACTARRDSRSPHPVSDTPIQSQCTVA